MWIFFFFIKKYFYPIEKMFYHDCTVTGPADAEPPPPVSVILDVVAVAKVYLSSLTLVIEYPAAKINC